MNHVKIFIIGLIASIAIVVAFIQPFFVVKYLLLNEEWTMFNSENIGDILPMWFTGVILESFAYGIGVGIYGIGEYFIAGSK
jgi:hypothetical protein